MSGDRARLTILLATDVFPPRCGGSGWSTYHLARALRERGHRLIIARPREGLRGSRLASYDDLPVHELGYSRRGTGLPLVRGVVRQDRFWPRFARFLADLARREEIDLIHGQHLQSIPAAVDAGALAGVPVVATVRDYWPTCPLGTRLRRCPDLPHCSPACQVCCLSRDRALLRPLVRGVLPYLRANLRRRQDALLRASGTIAVSAHVAMVLRDTIPGLQPVVLPNFITLPADTDSPETARDDRLVLYAGKLEAHKGADLLPAALARAPGARLVIAGDGALRQRIAEECRRLGVMVEFLGEQPHDAVLALMRRAAVLLFPARWEEPLTRTLLEAGSLGLPAVALDTGGNRDIVRAGETGVLVDDPAELGPALAAVLADAALRARMSLAARQQIAANFAEEVVIPRVEALYQELLLSPAKRT